MTPLYTATEHFALLPAILMTLFACAILVFDFLLGRSLRARRWILAFLAPAYAMIAWQYLRQGEAVVTQTAVTAFHGALVLDRFALFFNWLVLIVMLLITLISYRYLEIEDEHQGEYYALMLMVQAGAYLLATGAELVTLFLGLELMALSFYVLTGFLRSNPRSNEAALKYLLLGAFSSGILAYGFSILYGISGSTYLADIAAAVSQRRPGDPLTILAVVTICAGLLFKIAAAPFHMWAPDAYEGAPTPVTAFLSSGSKIASFALLLRLLTVPLAGARELWEPMIVFAAIASLTVGNLAAITQTNVKRLLAYSSIGHAGYMLLGLVAGNATGLTGIAVYAATYLFMTTGAFLVLTAMRREGIAGDELHVWNGLMHRHPGFALPMLLFLLSLAGLPPTAGFIGKYYIFLSLIESGRVVLAVIAALYVAVALYYYFRIVRNMFLQPEEAGGSAPASSIGIQAALWVTSIATLVLGIYPEPFLKLVEGSLAR